MRKVFFNAAERVLQDEAVPVVWPDDENEEGDSKSNTPAITAFFGASKTTSSRHQFFTSNKLFHIESI